MGECDRQLSPVGGDQRPILRLEAVLVADPPILPPVALRPVAFQQPETPAADRSRNWVDWTLLVGESFVAAVLVVFVVFRVVDGPVRDWLHARTPAHPPTFTQVKQPRVVTTRFTKPALGRSLPSEASSPRSARTPDYLTPARHFVPVAISKPTPPQPAVIAAAPAPPPDLRPVWLRAPVAGIDTPVVEVFLKDGVWQVADYAAGYHHGTGLPGDGNVVLAGHKGVRGAVFAHLERLKPGDDIFIDAAGQRFRYRVRTIGSVWPSDVAVMYPTPMPTLTLLTCTNWDMQRFVVKADLVDSAALAGSAGDS